MCSLEDFPPLPEGTEIPICINEGVIQYAPADYANVHVFTDSIGLHPHINISRDSLHLAALREDPNRVFLPVTDTLWGKIQNAWYEKGAIAMLEVAASEGEADTPIVTLVAKQLLALVNLTSSLYKHIPWAKQKESGESLVIKVSQNTDYANNNIRCLGWHPHCIKIAVGALDDSVRVFSQNSQLVPILKCKQQHNISCLAWRPYSASELAVGCEAGVILWYVDPNSVVTRPSTANTVLLTKSSHKYVTSIAWSPMGDLLVTSSACDNTMYVWDVSREYAVPLRRVGGGGITFVAYAPNSLKVFAATANIVFRVWETMKWEPDLWSVASGRVVSACWSPCGSVLLFATSSESVVYALTWGLSVFSSDEKREATPVIDVTALELAGGERVGGEVCSLIWDKKGRYIAVTFKKSEIIALFVTFISAATVHISPCCFIKGMPGEMPAVISFQDSFEEGANLTIGWSTGRVQYFPIIFSHTPTYKNAIPKTPSFSFSPTVANITESSRYMQSPF